MLSGCRPTRSAGRTLVASSPEAEIEPAFRRLLVAKARVFIVAEDNADVGQPALAASNTLGLANDALIKKDEKKKERQLKVYLDDIASF